MDIKGMQEALAALKSLIATLGLVLAIGFAIVNANAIGDGLAALADRFGGLRGAEIAGVKLDFGEATIEQRVPPTLFERLDAKDRRRVARDLNTLEPRMALRLLQVGLLANLCEFERPTTSMIDDFSTDHHLQDRGLASLVDNPQIKARVIAELAKAGGKPGIGEPRACYDITLTDHGWDVRTALVHVVSAGFGSAPMFREPAPDQEVAQEQRAISKKR
ncbi:hypothetical protein FM996_19720 [Methylosinus sporium]|uniref:Uncharacterized protein n=1 Tax=Methylosinus sporium TaxID=428 RepID=A0A549SDM4_METSR|nr:MULTISPECIES: hypothetical protein [Methylosinus]MBU3886944.1 hypothetical protein [Methylosinus sp. KRF6]TRL26573.1 hypothetical protein FM996_19720 [Methylosinus sporium]